VTQFYKGQRIDELLNRIAQLEQILHKNSLGSDMAESMAFSLSEGQATLAIAKAKLSSLQKGKDE